MFFNSHRIAFAIAMLLISGLTTGNCFGQMTRSQMMRQAQLRGNQQPQAQSYQRMGRRPPPSARVALQDNVPQNQAAPSSNAPISGSVMQPSPSNTSGSPIIGGPSPARGGYPMQMQGADSGQMFSDGMISDGMIIEGDSPIISDGYIDDGASVMMADGGCGCGDGGCGGSCGVGENYFGGCQSCCGNRIGGCSPNCWENCWLGRLGGLFRNSEWFAGSTAFRSRNFTANDQLYDDSSFGFYGGLNLGLPLCYLTCGLFSGQVGIRSVQTEVEGNSYTPDNRDQLFVTYGLFRRVDYGVQLGLAGDFMRENWFATTELTQVRGDIAWVYPGGNALGFRFATGTSTSTTTAIIDGRQVNDLTAQIVDNYRFYYRAVASNCGFCDAYIGWTDDSQTVFGLDYDMPFWNRFGLQTGFTYYLPDNSTNNALATEEFWNIFVGFSFRPQGSQWYGNYDRPLFNVADNGTFTWGRY